MDPRRQGQLRPRCVRSVLRPMAEGRTAARSLPATWTTLARCSPRPSTISSSGCRTRKRGSSGRGFSDRLLRPGSARPCCEWRPSVPWPWSSVFSSTGSTARSRLPPPPARASSPLRGKADRLDLLEDGTFRLIDYKLGWPPDRGRALQLPIYGICAEQRLTADRGRHWTPRRSRVPCVQGPETGRPALCHDLADATRSWPKHSSGSPTRSTRSSAASFRRRRTTSIAAKRAASRRCAGRTMSAISEPRLPFDSEGTATSLSLKAQVSRLKSQGSSPRIHVSRLKTQRSHLESRVSRPTLPPVRTPSIPRGTSCWRRRPAPGRRACSSSGTSTCCARASIRITFSR